MEPTKKTKPDFSKMTVVEIARLIDEGDWRDIVAMNRAWKKANPDLSGICTTALLNPGACDRKSVDWNDLRPMLGNESWKAFFGFCRVCAGKIEDAGMKMLSGSLRDAIRGAQDDMWERDRTISERVQEQAPNRNGTAAVEKVREPEPEPRLYAGLSDEDLAKKQAAVRAVLAALEQAKETIGEAGYASREKLCDYALLTINREQERRVADKARQESEEVLSNLDAQLREIGIMGAEPVEPKPARAPEPPRPVDKPKQDGPALLPCNCCVELKGNPSERLNSIPMFVINQVTTVAQAFGLLGETSGRYKDLLRMHAPEGASDAEIADTKNPKREAAKRMAKSCLLHGPEFRRLGGFRYAVICHIKDTWPDQWKDGGSAADNGNGDEDEDTRPVCEECRENPATKELSGGRKVCVRCKNRATRVRREGNKEKRLAGYRELRKGVRPNEGSGQIGNYKKKHKKEGKGKR